MSENAKKLLDEWRDALEALADGEPDRLGRESIGSPSGS